MTKKSHDVGDYYIAVDLAGFEEVNKKRTKNHKLDETAIAVVKVSEHGWYVDNIIYGRWSLDETAAKIFQAVRDYRPVSRWYRKRHRKASSNVPSGGPTEDVTVRSLE